MHRLQMMFKVLERLSQSPDLRPIQNLMNNLKWDEYKRVPHNVINLECFCKKGWNKMTKSRCDMLADSYSKTLSAELGALIKY